MKKNFFRKKTHIFICIISAFLCISFHVFAQEEDEASEERDFTREAQVALLAAQELMEQEDYRSARTAILEYIATEPESLPEIAYLMLGHLWYGDDTLEDKVRLGEALKVFKTGHEAFPESEEMLLNYAILSYESENFIDAGRLFEKLYDLSKEKDVNRLHNAAIAFYTAANLDEAKRVFKRMIDLPGDAKTEWYDTIIAICMEQEKIDEAESYVMQALEVYPTMQSYWQFLAQLRLAKEDYKGAAGALEIGYKVEPPEDRKGWTNLFDLYTYLNVPLRVATKLEETIEKSAIDEADHIKIAKAYASSLRIEKAIAYLDKVISQKPSVTLILQKGKILYDARKNQEAIEVFDECLDLDSKLYEAYMLKGFAAWDLEDWDTARDAFEHAQNSEQYGVQAKDALVIMDDLDKAQEE